MSDTPTPAQHVHGLLMSLRQTPPRLIQSPPTQPRRASVAMIVRLKPAPGLVFAGREPEGYTGEVIPEEDFGLGYGINDFLQLPWVNHPDTVPELLFIRRASNQVSSTGQHRWSSHIAFPGGRHDATDESALYTALRETWEEIGMDLAEREFIQVGRLDEREITTSLGKRLLMILSPFVFLQTTPFTPTPELQPSEVSSIHWIPLSSLTPPFAPESWSKIEIDISTRLSPRNNLVRKVLRGLVGKMEFGCVLLPDEPDVVAEGFEHDVVFVGPAEGGGGTWYDAAQGRRVLRLWGLSLGMTLDLLAHQPDTPLPLVVGPSSSKSSSPTRRHEPRTPVTVTSSFDAQWEAARKELEAKKARATPVVSPTKLPEDEKNDNDSATRREENGAGMTMSASMSSRSSSKNLRGRRRRGVGPGVTAVFPRFQYPDVNFWIWVFGRRYRQVVKGWESSLRGPDRAADRRMNWSGAALSTFYSAVRHALVVAIIIRALGAGLGIAGLAWLAFRYGAGGKAEL